MKTSHSAVAVGLTCAAGRQGRQPIASYRSRRIGPLALVAIFVKNFTIFAARDRSSITSAIHRACESVGTLAPRALRVFWKSSASCRALSHLPKSAEAISASILSNTDSRWPFRPVTVFGKQLAWSLLGAIAVVLAGQGNLSLALAEEKPGASETAQKDQPAWKPLFDGKTLKDWKITNFGGEGEVVVNDGTIEMEMGSPLTGITYVKKKELPQCDYEVRVEAMRIDGIDFFSTVTFPVDDSFCSLVVGGWAGPVVGISCIDLYDASENETTTYKKFEPGQWYRIRIQVRKERIRAWIDDKKVVDFATTGHELSTRVEVSLNEPFGIACFQTAAAIRKIEIRELPRPAKKKCP